MIELNKIYNENCLDTISKIPDNFIDLILTSPPYDGIRKYNGFSFDFEKIAVELYRILKIGGVLVWVVGDQTVNSSETCTSFKQAIFFKDNCGFNLYDTMIYRKLNKQPLNHKRYEQEFEYMFIFTKGKPKYVSLLREPCKSAGKINKGTMRNGGQDELLKKHGYGKPCKDYKPLGNIWSYAIGREKDNKGRHPAIFPEKLAEDHIVSWSQEQDIVYDPFAGSGTTLKVAKLLNRNFIGSEISKEYCDIIEERLNKI